MHPNPHFAAQAKQMSKRLDRVWKRGQKVGETEALRRIIRMTDPTFDGRLETVVAHGDRETSELPPFVDRALAEGRLRLLCEAGWIIRSGPHDAPTYERPKAGPTINPPDQRTEVKQFVPPVDQLRWVEGPDGQRSAVITSYPGYEGPQKG